MLLLWLTCNIPLYLKIFIKLFLSWRHMWMLLFHFFYIAFLLVLSSVALYTFSDSVSSVALYTFSACENLEIDLLCHPHCCYLRQHGLCCPWERSIGSWGGKQKWLDRGIGSWGGDRHWLDGGIGSWGSDQQWLDRGSDPCWSTGSLFIIFLKLLIAVALQFEEKRKMVKAIIRCRFGCSCELSNCLFYFLSLFLLCWW